jgi:hypothetical protein
VEEGDDVKHWFRGYVVSRGGTFGIAKRNYTTESGEDCVVIQWGPLGWITPVRARDCKQLASSYEREAREEAEAWLNSLPKETP